MWNDSQLSRRYPKGAEQMTVNVYGKLESEYDWHEEIRKAIEPLLKRITELEKQLKEIDR